jgi:hypothetical protein
LYCPGSLEAGATLVVTAVNTFFPITIPLCVPKLICAARLLTRSPYSKYAIIIVMLPLARRWDGVLMGICSDVMQVQEIQEVWQSRVVLEGITVAHRRSSQNFVRACVDINNLDACYLLGNCKNNWHNY